MFKIGDHWKYTNPRTGVSAIWEILEFLKPTSCLEVTSYKTNRGICMADVIVK